MKHLIKIELTVRAEDVIASTLGDLLSRVVTDSEGNVFLSDEGHNFTGEIIGSYEIVPDVKFVNPSPTQQSIPSVRSCPCMPENGGSGICGCVLGGVQITC